MAPTWLIDDRTIAKKVKNIVPLSAYEIHAYGATRECPNCHFHIDNNNVSFEWPGLPLGVKFNPSDMELLEHLAAKCGVGNIKPHKLIDEFIPTLEVDNGICYTHPEKLPGAKKDGTSVYFFHRTFNAYATGQRKRRRVQSECSLNKEPVRWHKTGRTKPVMEDGGVQKGWKKIMVLYKGAKMSRPDKSSWVMHQYHLGPDEDEREGEYVVSKIFLQQPKKSDKNDDSPVIELHGSLALQTSPRTPNPKPPDPPRPKIHDNVVDANKPVTSVQEGDSTIGASHVPPSSVCLEDDTGYSICLAGESQDAETDDLNCIDDSWQCKETLSSIYLNDPGPNRASYPGFSCNPNVETGTSNILAGYFDLENLELDTPPDFQLSDLNFNSQDSAFGWLDRSEETSDEAKVSK